MASQHWLVKQEPDTYSWDDFVRERTTAWTGVRNFLARNHLRAMKRGDRVLFYHSGGSREIVGLARVERAAYPDPTSSEGDWSAVDLRAVKVLNKPVSLAQVKSDPKLKTMDLVRQSRLSVSPVTPEAFQHLLALAETKL